MSKIPNDKRSLRFGSAFAIQDSNTAEILNDPFDLLCMCSDTITENFLKTHRNWVLSTTKNEIIGLNEFEFQCYSNGTSESFDKFYLKNHNKRFRCFKGEYMYHKLAWRDNFEWEWLENDVLKENDAVVLSLPFADTGNMHQEHESVLKICDQLNIPVLIDCAYFGICQDIEFNFTHKSITDIVFSLSKTFPVAYSRIGIRYSREDTDDTMFVYQKINYNNKLGAALGIRFLDLFSPDYVVEKYKTKQLEFCKQLKVLSSSTVLFGIGGNDWHDYNRGGLTNRLSFHKQFIQGLE